MDKTRLITLLRELRPSYGAVGTRDIDVRAQQERIDAAITELERAPIQPAVAWENPSTHAILRDESPDMCDNRREMWNALVYRSPALPAKPVATAHVTLEQRDGHTEVSEAVVELDPAFEALLEAAPGARVDLFASPHHVTAQAGQRTAEAIAIARAAIDVMSELHAHAIPDDSPDMDAVFPAERFREFVDAHARLRYRVRQFEVFPVEPAYVRLRAVARRVLDIAEGRPPTAGRAALVKELRDAFYATDDGTAGLARPVYLDGAGGVHQPGERALGRMDGLEEAARWHDQRMDGTTDAREAGRHADGLRALKAAAPFSFLPGFLRADAQAAAAHEGRPPNLSPAELAQFDRAVEQLRTRGETDYDTRLLLRWAAFGLLESTGFEPSQAGADLLDAKLGARGSDDD